MTAGVDDALRRAREVLADCDEAQKHVTVDTGLREYWSAGASGARGSRAISALRMLVFELEDSP